MQNIGKKRKTLLFMWILGLIQSVIFLNKHVYQVVCIPFAYWNSTQELPISIVFWNPIPGVTNPVWMWKLQGVEYAGHIPVWMVIHVFKLKVGAFPVDHHPKQQVELLPVFKDVFDRGQDVYSGFICCWSEGSGQLNSLLVPGRSWSIEMNRYHGIGLMPVNIMPNYLICLGYPFEILFTYFWETKIYNK